jgi:hypothetical protein
MISDQDGTTHCSATLVARRVSMLTVSLVGALFAVGAGFASAASAASAATPGTASTSSAPCTTRALSTPFSKWGDGASYFLAPNGGFESGSTGWTLAGKATVASGSEPYLASGPGSHSLQIPFGSQAQSPTMCVTRNEDAIRLFVGNQGVNGSILHVEALAQNPTTGQVAQTAFDVNGNAVATGWSPTMVLQIPNMLGGNGTQDLTLSFSTRGTAATWNIDDVFVDPFKSR